MLLHEPRRRRLQDERAVFGDRLDDERVHVEPRRAANTAARSIRTGSSTNRMRGSPIERIVEIAEPADVVDHRPRLGVVEERIDREIAAERVLFRRPNGG